MSNVKKGDLAIFVGPDNLGALFEVLRPCETWPASWVVRALSGADSFTGTVFKQRCIPGTIGSCADIDLRPLRGDPPAEVEKIADTQPSEVEA